ncbi:MAG TPA: hypothetical protein VMB81_17080 [Candidatus Sulfotelmatobacter sp.]|nr:hypothetical protein [Candidatus Sulfotelmatobacter sp.]
MANSAHPATGAETGARAALPLLFGIAMAVLFLLGLVLASGAVDDYTYFAGLMLAGFSLFVGARYARRYLP